MTLGTLGVGLRSSITIDPNIVDGRLQLDVVESALGEIAAPGVIADLIEQPIQARLDDLAAASTTGSPRSGPPNDASRLRSRSRLRRRC